jgi:menaquinone-dependent protoporphyrinogen oxidase
MGPKVLIAYGTKHGSTEEVACAIGERLHALGLETEVLPAGSVDDLTPYDGVVVGGALYMGRWHPEALHFVERHRATLASMPVGVFAMGPRTLEQHDVDGARTQLAKALAKVPGVDPYAVAVFGGVIDPRALRFPLNRMPASDARDWDAIRAWAAEVAAAFDFGKAAADARDPRSELQQAPR